MNGCCQSIRSVACAVLVVCFVLFAADGAALSALNVVAHELRVLDGASPLRRHGPSVIACVVVCRSEEMLEKAFR